MKVIVAAEYLRLYITMVFIYYYLEKDHCKVLTFHDINSSCFEISAALQKAPTLKHRNQTSATGAYHRK